MTTPFPPKNLMQVQLSGAVSSSDDWACRLYLAVGQSVTAASQTEMDAIAGSLGDAFATNVWAASPGIATSIATATTFTTVRTYLYNESAGVLVAEGSDVRSPVAGTGTTAHPAYCAVCVSLRTDTFGRSGRGRTYLPLTAMGIVSGSLLLGNAANVANAFAAFLSDINGGTYTINGTATTLQACVFSAKTGDVMFIKSVDVDTVPDTQHGRTNRTTGTRSSATVTQP